MHSLQAISCAALLALFAGCSRPSDAGNGAALPRVRVRLAPVAAEALPQYATATGTVRPVRRAMLAAKLMGAIEEMPVALGQRVEAGQVLVRIAAGEVSARVAQAQAQLHSASRDLERERSLLKTGASTPEMVRGLEDRAAVAAAMVREAEVMAGYATLRAPFSGVVSRKLAEAGDLASPGLPLVEIEGTDRFEVEALIPDAVVAGLSPGGKVAVAIPSTGVAFEGAWAEISPGADPSAHTVLAKISVPASVSVRSGEFARVRVPEPSAAALLVPASAIARIGQIERVFVDGACGRAELRLVKTGASHGDRVEILAGLDAGEPVVVAPPAGLREGQPLEGSR